MYPANNIPSGPQRMWIPPESSGRKAVGLRHPHQVYPIAQMMRHSEGHEQKIQRTKKIIVNTAVGGKDEYGQMKKPLSLPTRAQILKEGMLRLINIPR